MKNVLVMMAVLAVAGFANANLLTNAGFETGDTTGWSSALSGAPAGVVSSPTNSGSFSLEIGSTGAGQWSSPNFFQSFAAAPGQEFNMNGYILQTVNADPSWGTIKIEFKDISGANLTPEGVTIGAIDGLGQPYVGAVGQPQVGNGANDVNAWVFSEVQCFAPAGTVAVNFYLLNVNGADNTYYFDDISATLVPEPATLALLGLGGLLLRRKQR